MVGATSTVTPSAAVAAAAVPRVEASDACTAAAVVEAGTAMVAVMITLAAATLTVTSDVSTPAAVATFCCKLEVFDATISNDGGEGGDRGGGGDGDNCASAAPTAKLTVAKLREAAAKRVRRPIHGRGVSCGRGRHALRVRKEEHDAHSQLLPLGKLLAGRRPTRRLLRRREKLHSTVAAHRVRGRTTVVANACSYFSRWDRARQELFISVDQLGLAQQTHHVELHRGKVRVRHVIGRRGRARRRFDDGVVRCTRQRAGWDSPCWRHAAYRAARVAAEHAFVGACPGEAPVGAPCEVILGPLGYHCLRPDIIVRDLVQDRLEPSFQWIAPTDDTLQGRGVVKP
eukprot:scaffold33051_cov69-Phaeocystis_antarctica.AAC.2